MQWQILVVGLLALRRLPSGRACLQCDRKTRLLHEDFLLSAASVEEQLELTSITDHAYVTYRQTSQAQRGVVDPTTLYRASTEYHTEFDRFKKTQHPGQATFEAIQIMEKGRKILQKHLDAFILEGLCPNKCGQLYQRVIDCSSCKYKSYNCSSPPRPLDCGEQRLEAEEGGQAVLNCFLPWHRLLQGAPEYHFSRRRPAAAGTRQLDGGRFRTMVVSEEPSMVLNQLHADDHGTYRCALQDATATVLSTATFLLTVTAVPGQTPRQPLLPPSPPSTPPPLTRDRLLSVIATVTALSLVASIGLTVALGLTMKRRMKQIRAKQRRSVY